MIRGSRILSSGLTLFGLIFLATGCGPTEPVEKPVFPVHGSIFVNGKPAKGAVVMFHPLPLETGRLGMIRSRGTVRDDGAFQLTTYKTDDGAPEGDYVVTIYWPGKRTGKATTDDDQPSDLPPDQLGLRYSDAAKSTLKAQVKAGENKLEAFQLR